MSDIQRRIVTLFEARGAGQMRAALGQMRTGFGGMRRDLADTRRELGLLDKQWRAYGTTIRYALAGGTLFGAVGVVQQLNQIQQQRGLISAISETTFGQGNRLRGEGLREFAEEAQDAALRANMPVTELNDGLVNLVSTVQNVPRDQVVPILEQIAKTARLTQTPVDETTKGLLGLAVAFEGVEGVNLENMRRFLAEYQHFIFTVPGGAAAGPQVIGQLPQLAAVSLASSVNPEQLFGLLQNLMRAGGNPATSARGLQYLIQGLGSPPSDQARKALAGIGITPQTVSESGGVQALFRLIEEVRRRGGVTGKQRKILQGLSPETLDMLEGTGDDLSNLGISGPGADFAREAVGRIHGVRALLLLAARPEKTASDLREIAEIGANHQRQVEILRENWKAFEEEAQLQKVGLAINQMALDVVKIFEPVMNFGGRGVLRLQGLVDENPEASVAALLGGAGAFAASRRLRRGLGGGIGPAHAAYSAAINLGQESQLGATPTNPVFVAVVYSLSGWGRNASPVPPVTPRGPAGNQPGRTTQRTGRFGGLRGSSAIMGLGAAMPILGLGAFAIMDEINNGPGLLAAQRTITDLSRTGDPNAALRRAMQWNKKYGLPLRDLIGENPLLKQYGKFDVLNDAVMNRVSKGYLSQQHAQYILGQRDSINLKAKGEITVKVEQPSGKQTKSKVIMDFAPEFTAPAPQQRGQPTTRRGG